MAQKTPIEKMAPIREYNINYLKSKLLTNFFLFAIIGFILLKIVALLGFEEVTFPFFLAAACITIQYLIFRKFKNVTFSANLIILSICIPLVDETLKTGGLYSDNLLYFLIITPASILLLDIKQTIGWSILCLIFVFVLFQMEQSNPGYYFKDANFDMLYYFNAVFWLFVLVSSFMITSGIVLENTFKKLRAQKKQLIEQQDSLLAVNNKLKDAEQSLRQSNQTLERFAYATSHDLKQPVRTMSSFAKLADKRIRQLGINDEHVEEYLGFIHSEGQNMNLLIEQLMEFAKVKSNKKVHADPINVNDLIELISLQLNVSNEYPNTKFVVDLNDLILLGHPPRIRQLFQNLISNALKFSAKSPHPEVSILSMEKEDEHWFCVRDNGIGICKENHRKVFDVFTKLHNPKDYMGTGIGLSTCKEIIDQHKGRIWVESEQGEGCSFYFSFPKNNVQVGKNFLEVLNN